MLASRSGMRDAFSGIDMWLSSLSFASASYRDSRGRIGQADGLSFSVSPNSSRIEYVQHFVDDGNTLFLLTPSQEWLDDCPSLPILFYPRSFFIRYVGINGFQYQILDANEFTLVLVGLQTRCSSRMDRSKYSFFPVQFPNRSNLTFNWPRPSSRDRSSFYPEVKKPARNLSLSLEQQKCSSRTPTTPEIRDKKPQDLILIKTPQSPRKYSSR